MPKEQQPSKQRNKAPRSRESVAFHEASHAYAALRLKIEVEDCKIVHEHSKSGDSYGYTTMTRQQQTQRTFMYNRKRGGYDIDAARKHYAERWAIVCYAGPYGEKILTGCEFQDTGWHGDWEAAEDLLREFFPVDKELKRASSRLVHRALVLLTTGTAEERRHGIAPVDTVRKIADALMVRGELTSDEVASVVKQTHREARAGV